MTAFWLSLRISAVSASEHPSTVRKISAYLSVAGSDAIAVILCSSSTSRAIALSAPCTLECGPGTGSTDHCDRAIRLCTCERRWRNATLKALEHRPGEMVVEIDWDAGSFALMLKRVGPGPDFIGLDPDAETPGLAHGEATAAHVDIELH